MTLSECTHRQPRPKEILAYEFSSSLHASGVKDSATQSKLLQIRLATQPAPPGAPPQGEFSEKTLGVDGEKMLMISMCPKGK